MSSTLSAFIGSMLQAQTIYNEASAPEPEKQQEVVTEPASENSATDETAQADDEEDEEEEPEDTAPALREECSATAACAPFKQHFDHCTEKVNEGKGFKHEDCVEELFHLMHCVDNCIAPRLFGKLV